MPRKRDPPALNSNRRRKTSGSLNEKLNSNYDRYTSLEGSDSTMEEKIDDDVDSRLIEEARLCIKKYRERQRQRGVSLDAMGLPPFPHKHEEKPDEKPEETRLEEAEKEHNKESEKAHRVEPRLKESKEAHTIEPDAPAEKPESLPEIRLIESDDAPQEKPDDVTASTVSTVVEEDDDEVEAVDIQDVVPDSDPVEEVQDVKHAVNTQPFDATRKSEIIDLGDYEDMYEDASDSIRSQHALPGFWATFLEFLCTFTSICTSPRSDTRPDSMASLHYEMPLLSINVGDADEDIEAWGIVDDEKELMKSRKIAKAINFSSKRLDNNNPLIALYDENELPQEVHKIEVPDEPFDVMEEAEDYYDECFELSRGVPDAVVLKQKKVDDISVLEDNSIADSYAHHSVQAWSLSPRRKRRLKAQARAVVKSNAK